ncbi:hypothetical protein CAEBREN_30504 [Caenorhabditis brenneri]|uniref:RRM domain-containing protein n=1 Tax=Caenorhabditis brenneri TaxID=135651 RepID=G0MNW8_CAEBE|nr:hypothetical protein CAEBREN_30504 [Caenorhabditis brenneri]
MCIYNNGCNCSYVDPRCSPEELEELAILKNILATTTEKYVMTEEKQKEIDSRSIFVSNLDPKMTEDLIRRCLECCGSIKSIHIQRDSKTGVSKRFCFVEFVMEDSVDIALPLNGTRFKGNLFYISRKKSSNQTKPEENKENLPSQFRHPIRSSKYVYVSSKSQKRFAPY